MLSSRMFDNNPDFKTFSILRHMYISSVNAFSVLDVKFNLHHNFTALSKQTSLRASLFYGHYFCIQSIYIIDPY